MLMKSGIEALSPCFKCQRRDYTTKEMELPENRDLFLTSF